mgnify:CR=1 FL=1
MVEVVTFGCRINSYESEILKEKFAGIERLIIVNTCAVTREAERQCRQTVRKLRRENPDAKIVVTGCAAQINPKSFARMPEVDLVLGNREKAELEKYIRGEIVEKTIVGDIFSYDKYDDFVITGFEGRQRAFVQIQQGCDHRCTYCIVPYVRGRERSRDPQCVLQEVRELVAAGYKDITLLGQNVNSYGNDLDLDYHFPDLLEDIDKIPGEYLIRFMSSHPKDATNRLFDVMAKCSHVAKQLHLPFQSGNNRVLNEMNRRYTREKYLEEIRYAKSVMPGLVLTSDVIIGFPGETEAEAMDTVSLVEEVGFDALFTFIYSPRPGTKAAAMPDPATRAEKQKWFDKLLEVQNANSAKLHAAYVGKTVRVLVDGESDDENFPLASRTEGNRLVRLKGGKDLIGKFMDVKVTDSNTWALYGEPV